MFAAADLPVTIVEFRIRLNDFSEYFVATIAEAADEIIDTSDDQVVRRHAMEFRTRSVATFLAALNRPDPVASVIDGWAFCLQLRDYVLPGGAGADLFGDMQPVAIAATEDVITEMETLVADMAQRPLPETESLVAQWAHDHPLTSKEMARRSTTVALADQLSRGSTSPLSMLGRLETGVEDISAQLDRYIATVPRAIRWQAQLMVHETLYDELKMGPALESVDALDDHMAALRDFVTGLPTRSELEAELYEALAGLEPLIEAERARLIADVDRQRELAFADVTLQREAAMRDIERQIELVNQQVDAQLDEVFTRIEALTDETLRQSTGEGERLINLVFRSALILLLVGIGGGAVLIVLNKRLGSPARA